MTYDLRGPTFADSSALHAIGDFDGRARDAGTSVRFVVSDPTLLKAFDVVGYLGRIDIERVARRTGGRQQRRPLGHPGTWAIAPVTSSRYTMLRLDVRRSGDSWAIDEPTVIRAAFWHQSLSPAAIAAANEAALTRDVDQDARVHVGLVSTRELVVRPVVA